MSIDEGFMDGGAKKFDFDKIGDTVEGVIESVERKPQTDVQSRKPLFWPDGNPKEQFVFTLQTSLKEDDEDNGRRRIYAKKPSNLQAMIQAAVRAAKHGKKSMIGGTLKVRFESEKKSETKGFNPAKQFLVRFTPPVASVDSWGDEPGADRDEPGGDNANTPAPKPATRSSVPF